MTERVGEKKSCVRTSQLASKHQKGTIHLLGREAVAESPNRDYQMADSEKKCTETNQELLLVKHHKRHYHDFSKPQTPQWENAVAKKPRYRKSLAKLFQRQKLKPYGVPKLLTQVWLCSSPPL